MGNEERKPEKQEKVKDFLRRHQLLLSVLGTGAGLVVGGTIFIIVGKKVKTLKIKRILDILQKDTTELPIKSVDKDIFTILAPVIEAAVLDKGLEKVVVDRSYDLGDNLHKLVTVNIENVYGD